MEHSHTLQQGLIEKIKKGDSKAQFILYEQYVDAMYNVAYRITQSHFDAEDALQEAFVKAFQKIRSFKGESTFGVWLKRIVINQCLSHIRQQKRNFQPMDAVHENLITDATDLTIDKQVPIDIVMQAISQLPDGARIVFTLKAIEEYKFVEIAEILNLSVTNCKVQYHRSKKILSKKLKILLDG